MIEAVKRRTENSVVFELSARRHDDINMLLHEKAANFVLMADAILDVGILDKSAGATLPVFSAHTRQGVI